MNSTLGAISLTLTLVVLAMSYFLFKKKDKPVIISQAMLQYRYSNRKRYSRRFNSKRQSKNHYDKTNLKVIIFDSNAYWIKDNVFYTAPMVDHFVDKDNAKEVDTISMDRVQLDKMLFIMDKLREGINDDSRGSRDE